jgi:tetratricopeptide (TPR) repeat protein
MMGSGTPAKAGVLLLCAAWLAGCASPQVTQLVESPPPHLAPRIELERTPFYPQEDYQCGPAALAAVLAQAGSETTPQALVAQVYVPERKGSLQAEMVAATRRHGLLAYPLAPRLEDALREVANGTPVVVLQNLALEWVPIWHYAVLIGYDIPRREVVLRSGVTRRLTMTMSNFEHTWARSEYWSMVAVPPDQVPATATEEGYVKAAVALERVAPQAARRAYRAALERWPKDYVARMGSGNTAYAARDLVSAEREYRRASIDHPEAPDAWNNLAQALLELGRKEEAAAAARRAVDLGGPRLPVYRETLRAITGTP